MGFQPVTLLAGLFRLLHHPSSLSQHGALEGIQIILRTVQTSMTDSLNTLTGTFYSTALGCNFSLG